MKKLLATAIGAVALGAFADPLVKQDFESFTLDQVVTTNELNAAQAGVYWTDAVDATNTYTIVETGTIGALELPAGFSGTQEKALKVATKFGKPLSLNVQASGTEKTIADAGLYFDSLVKFTVCEEDPTESYDGAKIVMWLQETTNSAGVVVSTNLMVKAGYLSYDNNTGVQVAEKVYTCGNIIPSGFADAWHRVTIKAIRDITDGGDVPGFAIYIDGAQGTCNLIAGTSLVDKADSSFPYALCEAVENLGWDCIFPSLDQLSGNKQKLANASFDGTGWLETTTFTEDVPAFAKNYVAPKASVQIDDGATISYDTLAEALASVNFGETDNDKTATITLQKSVAITAPVTVNSEYGTIVLDFNGYVLTNNGADAIITNNAASLIVTDTSDDADGGIVCTVQDGVAICNNGGLAIAGGVFDGLIEVGESDSIEVSGGSFIQSEGFSIADGKKIVEDPDGIHYNVVDKESFTVKFVSGADNATTNSFTQLEGTTVDVPAAAEVTGKSFSAWDPAIAGATVTVTANATYTAQYTNNIYTITFVIGETSSSVQKEYGSTIDSVPEIPVRAGYTGAWDDDPAGDTVTGDKTYTAVYTANTYTVTFYTNSVEYATATYTYGDASTYTAPADPSVDGYTFNGWFTDNGTFESAFTFSENVAADTQVYAKLTSSGGGSWVPDPADVPAGKSAAEQYPALASSDLATANAKALTAWATDSTKGNNISMADVAAAEEGDTIYDAFLLNCAPTAEAVAAATENFKLTITFEGTTPVVTAPEGYNVTPTIYRSSDLENWSTESDGTFYKAKLEL